MTGFKGFGYLELVMWSTVQIESSYIQSQFVSASPNTSVSFFQKFHIRVLRRVSYLILLCKVRVRDMRKRKGFVSQTSLKFVKPCYRLGESVCMDLWICMWWFSTNYTIWLAVACMINKLSVLVGGVFKSSLCVYVREFRFYVFTSLVY